MPLTLTFVAGPVVTFDLQSNLTDPYRTDAIDTIDGLESNNQVSFTTRRFVRKRLAELEPFVAADIVQTANRTKVQLTSSKTCSFCRAEWNIWGNRRYRSHNEQLTGEQMEGLLVVTEASLDGPQESLTLTLHRGDWLYKPDGTIERFV